QPSLVAEVDRPRVAPVLSANPDLERWPHAPTGLDGHLDQLPHPLLVEGLERVLREHAALEVEGKELRLRVFPAETEGGLAQVVGPEGEELGVLRDLVGVERGPHGLYHGPEPQV